MSTVGSPSTVLRVTANCVTLANDDSFFFQKPAPPKVTPITPITTITTITTTTTTSEKKKKSAPAGAPQKALSEHDYCAPPLYSYHLTSDVLQPISDQVNEFHFLMVDPRSNRPIPLPPVRARFEVRKNGGGGGGDDEEEEVVCHCSECAENEPDNEPDSLLNEEAVITVEQVQQQKRKQQKQRKKQQQPKEQQKRPSSKSKAPKGALVAKKSPAQKKKKGLPLLSGGSNFISPVASTSTAFALRQILPKPSLSSSTLPSLSSSTMSSSSHSPSSMIIFADGIQTTSAPLAIHPSLSSLSRNNNNSKNNISNKSNSNTKKSSIGGGKSIISNINTKKSSSGGGKSISNIGIPTAAKTAASKKARKKVNKFEAGGGVGALLKVKEEKEETLSLPPPVSISAEKSNNLPPKKKKKKERPGPPPADLLCAHCLKTFASRTNLRKHLFRVQGIFPFSCGLCGTGVLYKRLLKEHRCGQQQEPKTTSGDAHLQQQPVSTSTWSSSMEEVVVKKEEEPENEAVKLLYIQPEPDQPHPQPEPDSTVTTTFSELLSAFD